MTLTLPLEPAPAPAPSIAGTSFLIIGAPKSGKSRLVNAWPKCLVIDTQGGHRHYGGLVVPVSDLAGFREAAVAITKAMPFPYDAVAIDTLDDLSSWVEVEALARMREKHGARYESISDVPHGAGWLEHRSIMLRIVKTFLSLPCVKVFVAHSRAMIDEETGENTKMVDLPGRLAHMVPGEVDHIGVAYRGEEGRYLISFEGYESLSKDRKDKRGVVQKQGKTVAHAGSRLATLNGKHVENSYEAIVRAVEGKE